MLTMHTLSVQLEGPGEPLKVDESSLTGESEAVTRRPGDTVSQTPNIVTRTLWPGLALCCHKAAVHAAFLLYTVSKILLPSAVHMPGNGPLVV